MRAQCPILHSVMLATSKYPRRQPRRQHGATSAAPKTYDKINKVADFDLTKWPPARPSTTAQRQKLAGTLLLMLGKTTAPREISTPRTHTEVQTLSDTPGGTVQAVQALLEHSANINMHPASIITCSHVNMHHAYIVTCQVCQCRTKLQLNQPYECSLHTNPSKLIEMV